MGWEFILAIIALAAAGECEVKLSKLRKRVVQLEEELEQIRDSFES